jgi:hypothetical protein
MGAFKKALNPEYLIFADEYSEEKYAKKKERPETQTEGSEKGKTTTEG